MSDIKPKQEMTIVETFDDVQLRTKAPLDKMKKILNKNKFIEINGELVNTSSIKRAKRTKAGEVESFILRQDEEIQEKLRQAKKQRKKENLTTKVSNLKNFAQRKGFINKIK